MKGVLIVLKLHINRMYILDINIDLCSQSYYKQDQMATIGKGGARGVMVIVIGNGHGDTSSNPRRD